jgi:pimeloyl-ACP methyl ester carboxylesterase
MIHPSPVHPLRPGRAGGPRVLLVHGMEDGWRSWLPVAATLPDDWTVAAVDLPWRTDNDYRWSRAGKAGDWLRSTLDTQEPLDLLVGHSFGASAVLDVLATGAGVPRAALVAPFYRPPALEPNWALFERSRKHFEQVIGEGLLVRLGHRAASTPPDVLETMIGKLVDRIGPLGFMTLFAEFVAGGELPLHTVRTPTLVLAGTSDPGLGSGRADQLAAELATAVVVLEERYDHFCHVRQAPEVAAHLVRFMAQTGGPA